MKQKYLHFPLIKGFILLLGSGHAESAYLNPDVSADNKKSTLNTAEDLPQDEDGWTVITPSVDSKIIYVSRRI